MRHSWLVDLKWIFGLACLASVLVAGGLYSASKLTERDAATGIFAGVAAAFAKEGGGSEDFEELQAQAAANPDGEFAIEGVTLPVKGSELAGLSYDEAVDLVAARVADILYTDGPDAVEQYFRDPPQADADGGEEAGGESGVGPFSILTQDTHNDARRLFTYSLIPAAVLAVPLVVFSRRFGRLGAPGVVLVTGAAPFALVWSLVADATADAGGDGTGGALADSISPVAGDLSAVFLRLAGVGAALILVALAGHAGFALRQRLRTIPETDEQDGPPEEPALDGPAADWDYEFPYLAPGAAPQP